jgi:DNA-binding transcriptional MerR regulator
MRPPKPLRRAGDQRVAGERPLKIGEAARMLGVEAYVLRFWETQFPFLRPHHASSSHRMYEPKDLEKLQLVKRLLHVEGYTIVGANKHIREVGLDQLCSESMAAGRAAVVPRQPPGKSISTSREVKRTLGEIREDLESLRKLLDD